MTRFQIHAPTSIIIVALLAIAFAAHAGERAPEVLEVPDDPYLAAAPVQTAPEQATVVQRGEYTSIQVNVDRNGLNIPGDAANEPTITVDPTNRHRITVGWRQFDNVASNFRQAGWAFSLDGGRSWTFPGVLEPGVFRSDPVLDIDANGRAYYNSLRAEGNDFWCEVYATESSGYAWTEPVFAHGGDKQWMSVDRSGGIGDGNIYSHWTDYWGATYPNAFNRSVDAGQTFDYPVVMPGSPYWGTTTVAPDGTVYVTGINQSGGAEFVVGWSTTAQDPNEPLAFDGSSPLDLGGYLDSNIPASPNPGGLVGQVWIAADHSGGSTHGNLYVLASVDPPGTDPLDVHFARSTDGGQTWSAPVRVNDADAGTSAWQWFGTMSVAPDGRIDVVFNDTRNDPTGYDSELYYSYSTDGGASWSPDEALSPAFDPHVGWPNQNKIGDYYGMVSDRLGADVIFSATFNGEQDVYYLRIGDRDCDGNGVGDSEQPDDDSDGIINACDSCPNTANPRQFDRNLNGIGDACEDFVFGDGFEWGSDAAWRAIAP